MSFFVLHKLCSLWLNNYRGERERERERKRERERERTDCSANGHVLSYGFVRIFL